MTDDDDLTFGLNELKVEKKKHNNYKQVCILIRLKE